MCVCVCFRQLSGPFSYLLGTGGPNGDQSPVLTAHGRVGVRPSTMSRSQSCSNCFSEMSLHVRFEKVDSPRDFFSFLFNAKVQIASQAGGERLTLPSGP